MVCHLDNTTFAQDATAPNIILHEHIYNIKNPIFFICFEHKHFHKSHPNIECIIREFKCCDNAISIKDYTECFAITTISPKKQIEWIIFTPLIWREQSYNHFMSFVRAIIVSPNDIVERYKCFETSNFTISNIRRFISGKESIIRTAVTGYETSGIYQTSTISCTIPYYAVVLPQKLYALLEAEGYDLKLAMVKRDPSISQTCTFVCLILCHPDPNCQVTTISDQQSKGLNQDQDGDRNAQYLIRKINKGYDSTKSYEFKVAKMEMANAFREKKTLVATPRYNLSEASMLYSKRSPQDFMHSEFFKKTYKRGVKFMNDAAAGYLSEAYDIFQEIMRLHALNEEPTYITVDDILLKSDRLATIVSSGAKGTYDLIELLLRNITSTKEKTLTTKVKDMLDLCNKYITSSQELSRTGRKQFAALFAAHDLVCFFEYIYINKRQYANYAYFASAGTFLFNNASYQLFLEDLKGLET